jgi:Arc/MetJ family transcription regulator
MRVRIVIDDRLMSEALEASGCATQAEAVEQGLKLLIQWSRQQRIRGLRGKVHWEGDWGGTREDPCEDPT